MSITVQDVRKRFGKFVALDGISLEVPTGSLVALLGPSGCGKTTLLRIIAGLESADEGAIRYKDEDVTQHSARDRNVGFVFQHYALFRHMSVFENVAFALRVRKAPQDRVQERVGTLLRLLRLEGLGNRFPNQLSGGQRQRVALGRALAAEPRVLLLDEPFGALDAKVRQELRQWLRKLHDELHVTSIFVTHDQEEAFEVSDKVIVMKSGRIEQSGSPQEVFEKPANAFVMNFLGNVNIFHGRLEKGRAHLGHLQLEFPDYPHAAARPTSFYVRPHEFEIENAPNGRPSMRAKVLHLNPAGAITRVQVHVESFGLVINVEVPYERCAELRLESGKTVYVLPRKVHVFTPAAEYEI